MEKRLFLLLLLCLPATAYASVNCQIIEYPDKVEAVCVGTAVLPQTTGPVQIAVVEEPEQILSSAQTPNLELPDVAPEQIVRNDLARAHGAYWLATRPGS